MLSRTNLLIVPSTGSLFSVPFRGNLLALIVLFLSVVGRADQTESPEFEQEVKPLLESWCVECHGGANPRGGFSMETEALFLKGSDTGSVIDRERPEESLLLEVISGEKPRMPARGDKLSEKEVSVLTKWIRSGARFPSDSKLTAKKKQESWWSLKKLRPVPVPVTDSQWVRNPIDAFVLEKLNERGLTPSPEADRRTLIRRLSFDLLGLPPTRKEVEEFVSDQDPQAYERLVDRLLASPRYGERWGRHWLDVVHFGESHGYDKDKPRPNAWPYRDYVIRALNEDRSYSRFVKEQIAGDLLYPDSPDGIIATGMIVAGPWDFVGHVELREGTTDKEITRSNDRDDMVSTVASSFLSLTVHCARCHDHKFDPITQEDYYRMQAVFAGIERADRPYGSDQRLIESRHKLEAELEANTASFARAEEQLVKTQSPAAQEAGRTLSALEVEQKDLPKIRSDEAPGASGSLGYHSQIESRPGSTKWVQVDLGKSYALDQVVLFPAHVVYGGHPGPGFGFPEEFRVEYSDQADFKEPHLLFDSKTSTSGGFPVTGTASVGKDQKEPFSNPGNSPLSIEGRGGQGRYVRVTASRLWERTNDWIFALSELAVIVEGKNVAAGRPVSSPDSIEAGSSWGMKYLVDESTSIAPLSGLMVSTSPTNGYHSAIEANAESLKWVEIEFEESVPLDRLTIIPARPTDFADTPGFGFPVRFRVLGDGSEVLFNASEKDYGNPGDKPLVIELQGKKLKSVRIEAEQLWKRTGDFVFALAELQAWSGDRNLARGATVSSLDSIEAGRWSTKNLVDGFSSRESLEGSGDLWKVLAHQHKLRHAQDEWNKTLLESVPETLREEFLKLRSERTRIQEELARLPSSQDQLVFAAAPSFSPQGNFTPPSKPRPIPLLRRGSVKQPGPLMSPGAVACLEGMPGEFEVGIDSPDAARRIALANWLTAPENGLLRRSIVNRVWHYHFGRGIVDSPNDFGRMGSLPTHPELLEWLALEFQSKGESLKALHRLIVSSSTYRQESRNREEARSIDGGNQYLWRMNARRLEAESLFDSILAVNGQIDLMMGGPSVQQFAFKDDHSPIYDYENFQVDSPEGRRRSVYRFLVRSVPDPLMETLDCADPSLLTPRRNMTLTPLQALALLNNKWILHQASVFADFVSKEAAEPKERVALAFELALQRKPEQDELEELVGYERKHGLKNTCRLLFNLNEFLFID